MPLLMKADDAGADTYMRAAPQHACDSVIARDEMNNSVPRVCGMDVDVPIDQGILQGRACAPPVLQVVINYLLVSAAQRKSIRRDR